MYKIEPKNSRKQKQYRHFRKVIVLSFLLSTTSITELLANDVPDESLTAQSSANKNFNKPPETANEILLRRRVFTTVGPTSLGLKSQIQSQFRPLNLIQFSSIPNSDDIKKVTSLGAKIIHYIPENAFLIWVPTKSLHEKFSSMQAQSDTFQFYTPFNSMDALSPALDENLENEKAVKVTVQFFNNEESVDSDIDYAKQLANKVISDAELVLHGKYFNLRLEISGVKLQEISEIDSVVNVEPYNEPKLLGERQALIMTGGYDSVYGVITKDPGYLNWLQSKGFSTDPEDYPIVAIVDGGVDNGTTSPTHLDFYEFGTSIFGKSRIAFSVLPPGSSTLDLIGDSGHGTLSASIVGAYNQFTETPFEDSNDYQYGLGISPFGRIGNVKVLKTIGDPADEQLDLGVSDHIMVADYYSHGTQISNNSWGYPTSMTYDTEAQKYDELTRDADQNENGNQELLFVFASGNSNQINQPNTRNVASPGTAKNVITVGASENYNPLVGNLYPDSTNRCGTILLGTLLCETNSAIDIAPFSSRGTSDNRLKPEIVAPGTKIHGAATLPLTNFQLYKTDGSPPGGNGQVFPPNTNYVVGTGTSFAAPAISGYASLIHEYLSRNHDIKNPSPALTKAFIIHSGKHLSGVGTNQTSGFGQGFGLPDMEFGFDDSAPRFIFDQTALFFNSGQSLTFGGHMVDPSKPLRIALVWTDSPAIPPSSNMTLINDLDLTVKVGNKVYAGNNLNNGVSQTGGIFDNRNNTEVVFLEPLGNSELVNITIDAKKIVGDAIPGNEYLLDQDFALVAYNFSSNDSGFAPEEIGSGKIPGTLSGATNDGNTSCSEADSPDVWFKYTTPRAGILKIDTCGTNDLGGVDLGVDTLLSVHSEAPGTSTNELACNDDWPSGNSQSACNSSDTGNTRDSAISMPITNGETVFVRVANYPDTPKGTFILNLDLIQNEPDSDGDGIIDSRDNCTNKANPDQKDTDSDGYGNMCDCDFNQDGFCGGPDFTLFIGCFNAATSSDPICKAADMNNDNFVGGPDFSLFIGGFNSSPGPSSVVQ